MAKVSAAKKRSLPRANEGILRYFAPISGKAVPTPAGVASSGACVRLEAEKCEGNVESGKHEASDSSITELTPVRGDAERSGVARESIWEESEEESVEAAASQVSDYERKRRARVAMNAQFLRELGMKATQLDVQTAVGGTKKPASKPQPKKRPGGAANEPRGVVGTRRSTRLKGNPAEAVASSAAGEEERDTEMNEVLGYDDSTVLKYSTASVTTKPALTQENVRGDGSLVGFREGATSLGDPSLRKIYSISFSPFRENALVAAGGHQGHVSIYASRPPTARGETLMSFRAHRGWISSLSLARSTAEGMKNLLLSAANDGVVKLWDLNQSVGGQAKELMTNEALHRNGIFGMDVDGDRVVTCSKDATIALSAFRQDGVSLSVVRRYEDHVGVVKTVQLCPADTNLVASGGNDRVLRVYDQRNSAATASQSIPEAHARVINSVAWHPTDAHLVLSASFDPAMHLFDLRKPSAPLYALGVSHSSSGYAQSIFHPRFVADGECVVSAGAGALDQLSLYRTADGAAVSRGQLPSKASYVAVDPFSDRLLVALGSELQFYDFKWGDCAGRAV